MAHAIRRFRSIFLPVALLAASVLLMPPATSAGSPGADFPLAGVLPAWGPHPDRSGARDLYGWMVGHWELESTFTLPDGKSASSKGEMHSAWVLEGRAIQDVWLSPRMADRRAGAPRLPGDGFGTTLRIYDPPIDAWRVHWFDPQNDAEVHIVGRRVGEEIVQDGTDKKGRPMRWVLSDMRPDSFRWRSEVSEDQGKTWVQTAEIRGRRRRD